MIISQKHHLIFSHNPKVAGSAARQVLSGLHDYPISFWHQAWFGELDRVVDAAHMTIHDLEQLVPIRRYRILTLVRDPYSRFMSSIAEHCRQHDVDLRKDPDYMNYWVKSIMDESNFRFNWKYTHFCPQHYFCGYRRPHEHLSHAAIKFDNPEEGWSSVREFLLSGFNIEVGDLPVVRSSSEYPNKFQVSDLDGTSIDLINRVYWKDFKTLGYAMRESVGSTTSVPSHYDRVNSIHNPNLELLPRDTFNEGELKALAKIVRHRRPTDPTDRVSSVTSTD